MEEGEEEEEEEEEDGEEEDDEVEILRPRKRIGRPPKVWSSILLPKEVTSALGTGKPRLAKSQKANDSAKITNSIEGEATYSKVSSSNMVGQSVHGVVDGCFDAGFLVSLRMGNSDSLYRGVVFGPGLLIPVSKETDIAKNAKRGRRKRKQLGTSATSREEPSTPPPPLPAPPREESPPSNPALTQPPQQYDAPPLAQHAQHPNAMHSNNFRLPRPLPEMNVNPFMHSSSFPPHPSISMSPAPQGYSPRQNFGHALPFPSLPYGYNLAGAQGRPSTPLPPQYRGPTSDPQYRGP